MIALNYQPVTLETELLSDENKSNIKRLMQLTQLNLNEISKLSWINLCRKKFILLLKNVADNLDNEDCKTTVNNCRYDLKNAEKILLEIVTKKLVNMKYANYTTAG